jgi:F-box domain
MSRLKAGTDLTSTFHEKLLVRVLSFLDVFDLFVARMVCVRWMRICEHPDLFRNINMPTFMMYHRYPLLNAVGNCTLILLVDIFRIMY